MRILLLLALIKLVQSLNFTISLENLLDEEWNNFKLTYNKIYSSPEEERFRREIFIENRQKVASFNKQYGEGKWSFVLRMNSFADMLQHEFHKALNGFNVTSRRRGNIRTSISSTFIPPSNKLRFPDYVDWREVGAVSLVKFQGSCASCWAFSAAGALEGQNFRKTGRLVELSPQNLVDCTNEYGNEGCSGAGVMDPSFEYVKNNPGIDTEESYPYEARDGPCRFRSETVGGDCTGHVRIGQRDELGLEAAVATVGPISAAIDASQNSFQFYSDGVYFDPDCGSQSDELNHAVLVVGYGTEPNGQEYWIIKNSYGPSWGRGGYMKLAKNSNNHCGIATEAIYPLV